MLVCLIISETMSCTSIHRKDRKRETKPVLSVTKLLNEKKNSFHWNAMATRREESLLQKSGWRYHEIVRYILYHPHVRVRCWTGTRPGLTESCAWSRNTLPQDTVLSVSDGAINFFQQWIRHCVTIHKWLDWLIRAAIGSVVTYLKGSRRICAESN